MGAEDRESEPGVTGRASDQTENPSPAALSPPAEQTFDEPGLADVLWSEPFRFEFFAALRVLAKMDDQGYRAGDDTRSVLDKLKFRALQSLTFPPSEIWDIKRPATGDRLAEITVAFLGVTGPLGALPRPYTDLVMQRVRKGDHALRDFLDLFNQRLLTIFARAGEKFRFYLTYELAAARERWRRAAGRQKLRAFLLDERPKIDLCSQVLLDVGGMGTPLLRYKDSVRELPAPRLDVADATLRFFSGHLAQTHRTAVALERILSEYFRLAARIIPFIGQWLQLPLEYQTCLKRRNLAVLSSSHECDPRLGQNTVVGSRIWEVQGKFRVRLGPLKFDQFQHFLPVGSKHKPLAHLVRLYVGATFDFDIQPVLEGPEVPWCKLGEVGSRAPRLGWNTWIRNQTFTGDVDDAIFRVPDEVSMRD
jgi:type VI secretion system protein ImpH